MPGSYNSFNAITIDADGFSVPLINETFNVAIVGGASLGTKSSDEFGYIKDGTFASATKNDIVEFSHATLPGTFRRKLSNTSEQAAASVYNLPATYIVNSDAPEIEPIEVELVLSDLDNPDIPDIVMGMAVPGTTFEYHYETFSTTRNLRVYANPVMDEGSRKYLSHSRALETADLEVGSPSLEAANALTVIAGESLTGGNLIDLYNDGGILKARRSDATDNTRPAEAFVKDTVLTGEDVAVYFAGNVITGLSALTQGGLLFLSETPGGVTHTPITAGTGKISQQVGQALSATSMIFQPQAAIELA